VDRAILKAIYHLKPDPGKNLKDYARYSGMAFQMLTIILAGVWFGWKLDHWLSTRPVFIVLFAIVSVFLAIYMIVKDLLRK
jgi:F0F1-type ATP synthase assembly protein I